MSIFAKTITLLVIFIFLNIFAIYHFDYKSYLGDEKRDFNIEEDRTLKDILRSKDSFQNSNFQIKKVDNSLVLDGVFSSQSVVEDVINRLQINQKGDISINSNRKLEPSILEESFKTVQLLKDFLENESKIVFDGDKISIYGVLLNKDYNNIVTEMISSLQIQKNEIAIQEPVIVEEKVEDETLTQERDSKEIIQELVEKNPVKFTKDDLQLLINNILKENKIVFERRSTELTPQSKDTIKQIADILKKYDNFKVEVGGHTDSRGNSDLNLQISQFRANSVKNLLESFGVASNRVTAVGYGNQRPIAKDDADGLSQENRRVEFTVGE